jgi:transaldolase/transaldolase/glucose-6-phosphate isomerase
MPEWNDQVGLFSEAAPSVKIDKMENNHALKAIHALGQSIWLDYFDRSILSSGKLEQLVSEGVSGITSNPSIFLQAINSSSDYNNEIANFSRENRSNEQIFYFLAVKDIKRAADILLPLYRASNGEDGFISLEVSPRLAYDTAGTIKQARTLWKLVDRKNIMIKIPATIEGLAAIRSCISEGININVTLLFGLPRYQLITEAYISGLKDRMKRNLPVDNVVSVASFFLGRIDVIMDPILEERGLNKNKGATAIAFAKKAYQLYKGIFSSADFKKLEDVGAKPQKLLWASTSSKNPNYSDLKYVESLIGSQTINTVTQETLNAIRDHGKAERQLEFGLEESNDVLFDIKRSGVDMDAITQKLEDEGIDKFNKAYDDLLDAIEKKRMAIVS